MKNLLLGLLLLGAFSSFADTSDKQLSYNCSLTVKKDLRDYYGNNRWNLEFSTFEKNILIQESYDFEASVNNVLKEFEIVGLNNQVYKFKLIETNKADLPRLILEVETTSFDGKESNFSIFTFRNSTLNESYNITHNASDLFVLLNCTKK
jgi:hypothetical protein